MAQVGKGAGTRNYWKSELV